MMKSAADRRQLARIQAAIDAHEAGLTPEQRAREKARLVYFAKPEAAALDSMKNVLRRLGVQPSLDDHGELWLRLWAAARHAGFSEEEFWRLTPRKLFAVLELKAQEREQKAGESQRSRGKLIPAGRTRRRRRR